MFGNLIELIRVLTLSIVSQKFNYFPFPDPASPFYALSLPFI